MNYQEVLEFLLKFTSDEQSLDDSLEALREIVPVMGEIEKQVDEARKRAAQWREQAEAIQSISIRIAATGGLIVIAYQKAASAYVKAVGDTESAGAAWLTTTDRLEQAQIRLGRSSAEAVQPYRERLADIAEFLANIAEKSPFLAKAIYGVGQLLAGSGGLGSLFAQGLRIKADLTILASAKMQKDAADKNLVAALINQKAANTALAGKAFSTGSALGGILAAPATGYILATIGGLILGALGYDQIAKATGGPRANEVATVGAYKFGQVAGKLKGLDEAELERKAIVFSAVIGRLTKQIDESSPLWQRASASLSNSLGAVKRTLENSPQKDQLIEAFASYKEQQQDATEQYEKARTDTIRQYAQQRVQLEADYERNRNQLIADYNRQRAAASRAYMEQERQAMADYAKQRAQLAEQFSIDMARAEEDFQRQMKQMAADHDTRVRDLLEQRDALGLAREQEDYERKRSDTKQQHDLDMARRSEDYAQQQAELAANFAAQRAQRAAAYRQQQAEAAANFKDELSSLDEQHKTEMAKLAASQKETLAELDKGYKEQTDQLKEAFIDRVRALDQYLLADFAATQNKMASMVAELAAYLDSINTNLPTQPRQPNQGFLSGGYVERAGSYRLAEDGRREFVLNNRTTQAAERIVGGRLSERALLAALAKRGVSGNTFNFGEDANQITRDKIVTWMAEVTEEIFD